VNKPAGMLAQPTEGVTGESLLDWATQKLGRPAGLVHRLDKETSGVTVFGKTPQATSALAAAFREGTARKRYVALTLPKIPTEGQVDLPLSKDPKRPGRYRAMAGHGIPASTRFRTEGQTEDFAWVVVEPLTGRTHQIRAHLTSLGFPILGDVRYGGARLAGALPAPRCLLHAARLELPHPETGELLVVEAPIPEDMEPYAKALKDPRST
jgi:23S rRNA pseudouridine1911/1915/1917 synthase